MLKILINNRTFFVIFLLWVVAGALLQVFFSETELIFWVNRHHNIFLDVFFKYITYLGEDFVWMGLLVYLGFRRFNSLQHPPPTALPVRYPLERENFSHLGEIKLLIITWLAKVFVSISLKNIFNLPRPMEVYQNTGREIHLVHGSEIYYLQSFPSGHTMTAFALACFVLLVLKQKKAAIFALFVAILVGYSRMYLFQHFPKDVFAGGILGVGVVVIVSFYTITSPVRRLRQSELPPSKGDFFDDDPIPPLKGEA